jgi:muramidase (phage lysozyme)
MPRSSLVPLSPSRLMVAGAALAAAASAGAAASAQAPVRLARTAPVLGSPSGDWLDPRIPFGRRTRRLPQRRKHPVATRGGASTDHYSIPVSIVMCESGGNYRAVNPSSGAGGAYQILPSTWTAYGGTGLPQDAPPAEQDAIAAKIYASGGPSQWSCA